MHTPENIINNDAQNVPHAATPVNVENESIPVSPRPDKQENASTASQVEISDKINGSSRQSNESTVLLADSHKDFESIQLSYYTPNPSIPLVKVFVVTNHRRGEEEEFATAEEAWAEFVVETIAEFHGHFHWASEDVFLNEFGRQSLGIPLGYGDKFLHAFDVAFDKLWDDHEKGVLKEAPMPDLSIKMV